MKLDGYETYCLFIALKNHFTQKSYDFFKYQGKTRTSKESFLANKDKYKYTKLSRKYDALEMRDFIISNLLVGKNWIGEMIDDSADDIFKEYLKRKQSITYTFNNETEKLFKIGLKKVFNVKSNQYPEILNLYLQNEINIETIAILNIFIQFVSKFDEKIGENDILWSKMRLLILKLTPFLEYDKDKIKEILKKSINNPALTITKEISLEKT